MPSGEAQRVLRDRSKAKNFDQLWHTYSTAFQEYFRSLSRKQKTLLINSGIEKGEDGLLDNKVQALYEISEEVRKKKEKSFGVYSDGVIIEQAETSLGGRSNLENAVRRGAVKVSVQSGLEMFHIPRTSVSMEEKCEQEVKSMGKQLGDEILHEGMKEQGASIPSSISPPGPSHSLGLPPMSSLSASALSPTGKTGASDRASVCSRPEGLSSPQT